MFDMTDERLRAMPASDALAASASRLWGERVNPIWWQTRTPVGDWLTDDRRTWRTTDGHWLAQVQRSANGRHVFMALWHDNVYVGFQDDIGWHPPTVRSRTRHPHPVVLRYAKVYMDGAARRELQRQLSGGDALSLSEPHNWDAACQKAAPELSASIEDWAYGSPVDSAIRRIPPAQQTLLKRRYVHDASLEEIAIESNTSVPAVSQRLATARKAVVAAMAA
jgi:hypothetical protein